MTQREKETMRQPNEHAENEILSNMRITQSHIDNTLYIVESVESKEAAETVHNKLKRLILNNAAQR